MGGGLYRVGDGNVAAISRVAEGQNDPVFDVHIAISVSNLKSMDELAQISMSDASTLIGV
jgi:hypothetical protein